jgi:hypothetical protein
MGEAERWSVSRAEFRKLAGVYPDFASVRERLRSGGYIWRPRCESSPARKRFKVAATRAALIRGVPAGMDPVFHWHQLLITAGLDTSRVLAASAEYCADQERKALPTAAQQGLRARSPRRRDLLETLSEDDPNYEVGKRFYLESWADSHGLVADAFSGQVSLPDFVKKCVNTFEQGMRALLALKDETPIPARCREVDKVAKAFIRQFGKALKSESQRLGRVRVETAMHEFSRQVTIIAARTKESILRGGLTQGSDGIGDAAHTRPSKQNSGCLDIVALSPHQLKAKRAQRMTAAQARWRPIAKRTIPFRWIHRTARVDHKDAYEWKNGKLPEASIMSKNIERVLQQANPPTRKMTD